MASTFVCMALLVLTAWLFVRTARSHGVRNQKASLADWAEHVYDVAGKHTQVTGLLAGFNITVIILFAARVFELTPSDEDLIPVQIVTSMFMTTYFGYVVTGFLYSLVIERPGVHRYALFSVASCLYYFSVTVSFTALLPLVQLLHFESLEIIVLVMVMTSIVGGYQALIIPHHDLLLIRRRVLLLLFLASIPLASLLHRGFVLLAGPDPTITLLRVVLPASCLAVASIFGTCMVSFLWRRLSTPESLVVLTLVSTLVSTSLCLFLPFEFIRLWFRS